MSTASAASPTASEPKAPFTLVNVVYHGMMGMRAAAIVTVNIDGRHESAESHGDGPIDAAYKAIQKIVPHNGATFMISHVENAKQSEGSGGVAHVRADFLIGGTTIVGEGNDTDTVIASAQAMIAALNQIARFDKGTAH